MRRHPALNLFWAGRETCKTLFKMAPMPFALRCSLMTQPSPALPQFTGAVELRPTLISRPQISHVVFDFDGTLSWLRHGWPEIMHSVFSGHLPRLPSDTPEQVDELFSSVIFGLNGKPTIVQMHRF